MNFQDFNVFARREPWNDRIEIRMIVDRTLRGHALVAKPIAVEEVEEGGSIEPFLRLENTAAQKLMDELWNCGLRPSEGSGSAGALAATERHLDDFRKLVFDRLYPAPTVGPRRKSRDADKPNPR